MFDIDRARRSMDIFTQVFGLRDEEQRRAVAERCRGDLELQALVEALLAGGVAAPRDEAAGTDASPPSGRAAAAIAAQIRQLEPPLPGGGSRVAVDDGQADARFTLLRLIGEGGMGSVYEAQQHAPRRRVAIKAIRPGRISPQLRERFEDEARVLGRLEHPNIARLYEYDTQAEGGRIRAFLAMELVVDGVPIDQFCDERTLDVPARLRLVMKVCGAVAYAHRMGVVHRDLKPANILVTPEGEPKILDFGVARIIAGHTSNYAGHTALTAQGQVIGTLAYMSPEQVQGQPDVDARSDVYALGVILYKLLTGELPIPLDNLSIASAAERLLNHEPRPIGASDRTLRGDLEVIVARALEKDRDRRYASVERLSAEIERFLAGRPIETRGDSGLYVVSKALRRHRRLAVAASATCITLAAFGTYAAVNAVHSRRLAIDADHARVIAEQASEQAKASAERARQALYVSRIGFAQSAIQNDDIERVHALLDECEPSLRGWEWYHLRRMCDLSTSSRDTPMPRPRYVVRSTDGQREGYATLQREVLLIDRDGRERLRETLPDGNARVALSGDGKLFAFGGVVTRVSLLNVETGERRELTFKPPATTYTDPTTRGLRALRFTADGRTLVSMGLDRRLRIWDVATGTQRRTIDLGEAAPVALTFVKDDRVVLVGDAAGALRGFDLETGEQTLNLVGHDATLWSFALSTDGAWLASGDSDARVIVWDLHTGQIVTQLDTNDGWITALAFNADHSMLAIGRSDSTIRLVHLPDLSTAGVLRGHRHAIVSLAFDADGSLRSASLDGTEKRWDPNNTSGVPAIDTGQRQTGGIAFTPDGRSLLVGGGDGSVRRVRLDGPPRTVETLAIPPREDNLWKIAIDPTRKRFCTAARDGVVQIGDLETGTLIRTLARQPGSVPAAIFTPDGSKVLIAGGAGLLLVDAASAQTLRAFPTPDYIANDVIFNRDGGAFVIACSDGKVRRWPIDAAAPSAEVVADRSSVYGLALSPDGASVVATGDGGTVTMLDAVTLQVTRRFAGHQAPVTGVAFDPTGTRIATSGNDRMIRIWDASSGTQVIALRGHRRWVQRVAFSPDGRTLASTSDDGTVRLWSAPPNKE